MFLRQLIVVSIFTLGVNAMADDIKTTYSISGSSATVTTVIKKASSEQEQLMRTYLFDALAKKLKQFPNVTAIEYTKNAQEEKSTSSYSDTWTHTRKFPVMIHLALPTPVTLMMKVEESYHTCKSPAEKPKAYSGGDDYSYSDSSSVDCSLDATVKVTGPFAVYGNFASSLNVEKLLKDRQDLSFEVSRDYSDKTSVKIVSRFNINSELFDRGLIKFLEAFNVKLEDGSGDSITRNYILVGIARVLRVNNERLVEL